MMSTELDFIEQFNDFLAQPSPFTAQKLFTHGGFIRLNMLFLDPASVGNFLGRMSNIGMKECRLTDKGLTFNFGVEEVFFLGPAVVCLKSDQILCLEMDFEPIVSKGSTEALLMEIESILKLLDVVFFIFYAIDPYNEICENPLSDSIEYLSRRVQDEDIL